MAALMFGWLRNILQPRAEPAVSPSADGFQGIPWNAAPTEEWNQPPYWDNYYRELLTSKDRDRSFYIIYREVDLLIRMLTGLGELPRQPDPVTILEAGCGISLIPHLLAYWGFCVTAVDSCSQAVARAAQQHPTEEELARCIRIWVPITESRRTFELVEDPAQSLAKLRSYQSPGGSVRFLAHDWFGQELDPEKFDLIYCRNSLRCSTKAYWRRSLQRFHDLLTPGGVLLLENVNAIGIQDEVEALYGECGLMPVPQGGRSSSGKYVLSQWPTG
jgi:SAM-dependent methyltransferase